MYSLYKNEQSGRSMVEMLGVLAIIGVLSIGGISGYSRAMSKYRVNKTLDQISMLVMNIRSLFSASVDYANLTPELAVKMGIVPRDMLKPDETEATATGIMNAYNGSVFVGNPDGNTRQFYVEYTGLTQEACVSIATADWGSQAGSGLVSIAVGPAPGTKAALLEADANPALSADAEVYTMGGTDGKSIPISISEAATQCSNSADDTGNAVRWVYY